MYTYVRARQLEGTYPGSPTTGTRVSTNMRVAKGWGVPEETEWPFDGNADHWPPVEPPGIDVRAKRHRILAYERASSVDECRVFLAAKTPVAVAVEIDSSWYDAPNGIITMPTSYAVSVGHCVSLVDYEEVAERFISI